MIMYLEDTIYNCDIFYINSNVYINVYQNINHLMEIDFFRALHFITDTFGQYDYGPALNVQHYNSTEPPTYDLKSIQVPITLIHGENDILADTEVGFYFIFLMNALKPYSSFTVVFICIIIL